MALEIEAVVAAVVDQLACLDLADAIEQQAMAAVAAEHRGLAQARLEHHHVLHVDAGFQVVAGRNALHQGVAAGDAAQFGKLLGQVFLQVRGVDIQATGLDQGEQQ
ncbi:hypothetical protein D9M71_243700 [compost metagenome]